MTDLTITPSARATFTPEQRFLAIGELHREAERLRLTACVLLADAYDAGDWQELGYDDFGSYAKDAGIPSATTASKMLLIGRTFSTAKADGEREPMWSSLPEVDRRALSIEGLYEAARNVKTGAVADPAEALHDAVAMPVSELIAKGKRVERVPCDCPNCGDHHFRDEPVEDADLIPF